MFEDMPQTTDAVRKRIQFIYAEIEDRLAGINDRAGIHILDIGCGSGQFITIPIGVLGASIIGIDTHLPSVELARTINRYSNVHFECMSVDELHGRTFDFVICSEVLEHLNEPGRMVNDINRLLKSNGIAIITIPNGYGPKETEGRLYKVLEYTGLVTLLKRSNKAKGMLYKTGSGAGGFRDTLNEESPHIQFFTLRRFHKMLHENGLSVRKRVHRRFLSGPFSDIVLSRSKELIEWNARVADRLPYFLVSSWMFVVEHAR